MVILPTKGELDSIATKLGMKPHEAKAHRKLLVVVWKNSIRNSVTHAYDAEVNDEIRRVLGGQERIYI